MTRPEIYLDHAATCPILPEVVEVVTEALVEWRNPSSVHAGGRRARARLEEARARVAAALHWQGEVIFTGGATEALAMAWTRTPGTRKFASAVEHTAVLRFAGSNLLGVDAEGVVDVKGIPEADLVAVMQVNNETGVIQPLEAIAERVRHGGGLLLADCAQGVGKLALPDADLIAVAGHKIGAPPGVGALLVRDIAMLAPGGGQERGYRPGTENLPYILGLATALEAGRGWIEGAGLLRAWFDAEMMALGAEVIGGCVDRVPTIGAYRVPGMGAAGLLIRADARGVAISAGSACASGSIKPSHVLLAMGLEEAAAREVFRVSIGRGTRRSDLEALLAIIRDGVRKAA